MLNIMTVAYRGYSLEQLQPLLEKKEERRKHLYNAYIKRVFERRPLQNTRHSAQQALHWLRFLAGQLTQHDETQFFIEDLQPDWLPVPRQRRFRVLSGLGLASGLRVWSSVWFGASGQSVWLSRLVCRAWSVRCTSRCSSRGTSLIGRLQLNQSMS